MLKWLEVKSSTIDRAGNFFVYQNFGIGELSILYLGMMVDIDIYIIYTITNESMVLDYKSIHDEDHSYLEALLAIMNQIGQDTKEHIKDCMFLSF